MSQTTEAAQFSYVQAGHCHFFTCPCPCPDEDEEETCCKLYDELEPPLLLLEATGGSAMRGTMEPPVLCRFGIAPEEMLRDCWPGLAGIAEGS